MKKLLLLTLLFTAVAAQAVQYPLVKLKPVVSANIDALDHNAITFNRNAFYSNKSDIGLFIMRADPGSGVLVKWPREIQKSFGQLFGLENMVTTSSARIKSIEAQKRAMQSPAYKAYYKEVAAADVQMQKSAKAYEEHLNALQYKIDFWQSARNKLERNKDDLDELPELKAQERAARAQVLVAYKDFMAAFTSYNEAATKFEELQKRFKAWNFA